MSDVAQTLKAGGIVPVGAKLGKDEAVDTVVARAYHHPVLPGRTVIRLTAENVTAGDDLEMATLGFGPGEDRGAVGVERKRPLGFPGWALVNDPENARYALAVVKEFKKHARKAKSKPGHAKDGIDAIAERLGKSVPHFLPAFYEEAGRAFIEHGAPTFAAAMFGKAREAEAVHALDVDEQHRVDGFLEFALAGAVTTKALAQYAKELGEHHEPKVAYRHFLQLCLQRTLGGMPPWSGMAKELRRLAKAAKLDPDAEDRALVAEIIASPALGKAAGEFWRAYQGAIVELGKRTPTVRGALLNLFPTGSSYSAELDDIWLELLDKSGAVDALVGEAPAEARPSGGRAAWFDKLTQHLARSWRDAKISDRAFALLRRMAPALIADGAPITCAGRYNRVDLDLCELALELGVPVKPPAGAVIVLDAWAQRASEPGHGCDPVRAAAHPEIGPLLVGAVAREIGDDVFDAASRGKPGFLAAKRAWLEGAIARAESGGLPALAEALATIESKVKPHTFGELPDLHARFAALDVAPLLARSLHIGIIDELGWPVLEEAAAELEGELTLHGGAPALVLASKTRAIAIGALGRLGVHDFVIPSKHELVTVRFIGGQFLVVLKESYKVRAYWSAAPHSVFDSDTSIWAIPAIANRAAVLADGAWLEGTEPLRASDRKLAFGGRLVASDGATAWTSEWKDGEHKWREITQKGEAGRFSWPAWIEAGIEPDWKIDGAASYVLPAPAPQSPLGTANGLVGSRIRYLGGTQHRPGKRDLTTIDGATFTGPIAAMHLLSVPGDTARRPVLEESAWREGVTASIYDPTGSACGSKIGKDRRYLRGQAYALPPSCWHAMTPRDPAGSQYLRSIDAAAARAMLDPIATAEKLDELVPVEVVPAAITDPRLRRGVAGLVALAAGLSRTRDTLRDERAPGASSASATSAPDDSVLLPALLPWTDRGARRGSTFAQVARVAAVFATTERGDRSERDVPAATIDWFSLAVAPSALAFIATAIGTPADKRALLVELLQQLVRDLPPAAKLRTFVATGELEDDDDDEKPPDFEVRWLRGNAYAIRKLGYHGNEFRVLEYAPGGTFAALPGLAPAQEVRGSATPGADDIAALASAVAAGQTSWSPAAAAALAAATGLTPSEASYLWAGCPNANDRSASFLDKELRELLGLKATQAQIARDGITALPLAKRIAVAAVAGAAGAAALLDGRAAGAMAEAWKRLVGVRVAIPEDLLADADRELQAPIPPAQALALVGSAASAAQLANDGTWALDANGAVIRASKPEPLAGQTKLVDDTPVFDASVLATLATYLPFVYAELPVGDPLRACAPIAHARALERLANRTLWLEAGAHYFDDVGKQAIERLIDGLGGTPLAGLADGISGVVVPGAAIVRRGSRVDLKLRPAMIDAKSAPTVKHLAAQIPTWGTSAWHFLEYVRSPGLAAMMARIGKTPVAVGGWEQNPLASVGKLVDKAAKRLRVSRGAAAVYLQYLALLWPTAKNLALWNGWKPKQVEAANAELLEHDLILEAKRERAQRAYFLPGGWEALKSPHPPMETWKLAFYGQRNPEGTPVAPLGRFLALGPFHTIFETAWERVENGDVPRYDEVKR